MTNSNQGLQPNVFYTIAEADIPKFVEGIVKEYLSKTQEAEDKTADDGGSDLMSREQVAQFLGVTKTTLSNWARLGYLPCIHIGRGVRYYRRDVVAFAVANNKQ